MDSAVVGGRPERLNVAAAESNPAALFIHLGGVGDFVLSLRVVQLVAQRYPQLSYQVVGHAERAALAVGRSPICRAWSAEQVGLHRLRAADAELGGHLAGLLRAARVVVSFLGAAEDLFHRRLAAETPGKLYSIDPRLRANWPGHVTEQWLRDLAEAGLEGEVGPPRLVPTDADLAAGLQRLAARVGSLDRPVVVLHPGSGSESKCWPVENYMELASCLRGAGCQPVFLLGPAEAERWPPSRFSGRFAASMLSGLDLEQAVQVLAAGRAYVGNDSGMTHLAAALGVATVAIFGPTRPQHWAPLGDRVRVFQGAGGSAGPFASVRVADIAQAVLATLK